MNLRKQIYWLISFFLLCAIPLLFECKSKVSEDEIGKKICATDLIRFLHHIDRNSKELDIISSTNLNELYFGYQNWIFFGSLPGISSAISRVNNSFGYSIIVNTRTVPIDNILNNMNTIMVNEIDSRTSWPTYNLLE